VISDAKRLHPPASTYTRTNLSEIELLQDSWTDVVGKGVPMFMTRRADFMAPLPTFNYMFPVGQGDHEGVRAHGVFEPFLSHHLKSDLRQCCGGGAGHVMDVGSGYGWYALLSASLGCRVDAYEPVPWSRSLLSYNKDVINSNAVGGRIRVHSEVLMSSSGRRETLVVPTPMSASAMPAAVTESSCGRGAQCYDFITTTVDEDKPKSEEGLVSCAWKISAEGTESDLMNGGKNFLAKNQPKLVILEVSQTKPLNPGQVEFRKVDLLQRLVSLGYEPYLLTMDLVTTTNMNVATGAMGGKLYKKPLANLLMECGSSCVVYMKRP